MQGTVTDSNGGTWKWVQAGYDRYKLQQVSGNANQTKGIYEGSFPASDGRSPEVMVQGQIVDRPSTIQWGGYTLYPDMVEVHANGRLIEGMGPGW